MPDTATTHYRANDTDRLDVEHPDAVVVSVTPDVAGDAAHRIGTAGAVRVIGYRTPVRSDDWLDGDRIERQVKTRPDGTEVTVEFNADSGASRIVND